MQVFLGTPAGEAGGTLGQTSAAGLREVCHTIQLGIRACGLAGSSQRGVGVHSAGMHDARGSVASTHFPENSSTGCASSAMGPPSKGANGTCNTARQAAGSVGAW